MTTLNPDHLTTGSASPFLPGTNIQYAWDSTSLGYMKTCPRLYQYIMIDGWGSRDESVHLRFGIEYHKTLEEFDIAKANGASHDEAMRHAVTNLLSRIEDFNPDESTKAGKYKNRNTLVALVIDYMDHFSDDPATTVILDNGKPAVELSFRFELDWGPKAGVQSVCTGTMSEDGSSVGERIPCDGFYNGQHHAGCGEPCTFVMHPETGHKHNGQPYILSGHLDRVVDFNGELLVMDRKTTTTTPGPYYFHQYEPSNQMTLYTLAGQVVLGTPIKGVVIDAAQVLIESPNRFVRGFTYRNPDQLEEWLASLHVLLNQAEAYAIEGFWPMNDTACDKFGGCRFREICSKSPQVREAFLKSSYDKLEPDEKWNPLRAR